MKIEKLKLREKINLYNCFLWFVELIWLCGSLTLLYLALGTILNYTVIFKHPDHLAAVLLITLVICLIILIGFCSFECDGANIGKGKLNIPGRIIAISILAPLVFIIILGIKELFINFPGWFDKLIWCFEI